MPREYWRHLRQAGWRMPRDAWPHEIVIDAIWSLAGPAAERRLFCEAGTPHRNGITASDDLEHVRKMGRQRSAEHLDRFSFLESTWGTAQLMLNEGIWNAVIKLAETLHHSDIKYIKGEIVRAVLQEALPSCFHMASTALDIVSKDRKNGSQVASRVQHHVFTYEKRQALEAWARHVEALNSRRTR
jgi:hypothetical protein